MEQEGEGGSGRDGGRGEDSEHGRGRSAAARAGRYKGGIRVVYQQLAHGLGARFGAARM